MIASERVAIIGLDDDDQIIPVAVAGISAEESAQWMAMLRGVPLARFLPAELVARLRAGEDFTIDTTPQPRSDASFGTTSALLAPMLLGDRLVGTLSVDFGAPPTTAPPRSRRWRTPSRSWPRWSSNATGSRGIGRRRRRVCWR